MRVLFVSDSPIRKEISIGNTFLNIFDGMENVEFASICTREGTPDTKISKAFCITEKSIIKNLVKGSPTGKIVDTNSEKKDTVYLQDRALRNNKLLLFLKNKRLTIFFWIQDLIWKFGRWKSKELTDFLNDYQPDMIFTVFSNMWFLNKLVLYIQSHTNTKLAVYAWDNNYTLKMLTFSPLKWLNRLFERREMRKVAKKADLFYVISNVQKKDYEKAFKRQCKLLTKGENFECEPAIKKDYEFPLQLIYTGNIGLNRWKSLKIIADALKKINTETVKAQLKIYTATPITKKMEKALNVDGCSYLMGAVTADEVQSIQKEADILVHVEAFDLKNRLIVRQSFSTKIVDYLKMAKSILAVGPKDVASITHLIENDCAITGDSESELFSKLTEIIDNPQILVSIAQQGYRCGKIYHNKKNITEMLKKDFGDILK